MTQQATQQTPKTKLDLMNRLRAEGRWDKATEFRAKCRERHKSSGKTKRDSNALAWQEMATKYPPLPEPVMNSVPINVFAEKPATTVFQDIEWVYQTMAFQGVGPEQARSGGAWGLLCWERERNKKRSGFFKNLLSRILPSRSDHGRPVPLGQGKSVSQAEINRLLGPDPVGGEPMVYGRLAG